MKKLFIMLSITFNIFSLQNFNKKVGCDKSARCYDKKLKRFRPAKEGEKSKYSKGNPNSKIPDLKDEHCVCSE